MTIVEIVTTKIGKRAGNWNTIVVDDGTLPVAYELYHYNTCMLRWAEYNDGNRALYLATGHGSKSDQKGMNKALRALGMGQTHYYSRTNGPQIVDPYTNKDVPTYMKKWRNENPLFFKRVLNGLV